MNAHSRAFSPSLPTLMIVPFFFSRATANDAKLLTSLAIESNAASWDRNKAEYTATPEILAKVVGVSEDRISKGSYYKLIIDRSVHGFFELLQTKVRIFGNWTLYF